MERQYKYDIAISFAEEDYQIAKNIALALRKINLEPYYYKDDRGRNWGTNLLDTITKVYKYESRFALILVSKNYLEKKWTTLEREIIQSVHRDSADYLLPLKLDDTQLPDMPPHIIHEEYSNNPDEIAVLCHKKIQSLPIHHYPPFDEAPKVVNNIGTVNNMTFNL
ncbi:toll/interleukin-1 receptor domain-containing protein [Hyunsoonleella pacifica]|uniref:Toll/interleukin-1 receptor domain-containing protein n=1 Tax=Hyunsoonleella pacifica TaxID=1080224 RepID=A0A4Q9FSR9_9FLAO|nr:toll/interleukin-1 receptor domain-containing protein [Hyunsoonleella pacifica]TBN18846.1 toll/interleukin-1 receptor domain-containing protein [Hyunsoonleella pacifica]GGD05282.1 hypothetical protein GCM10011368_03840 [Hyunsoonleella pacifica]